MDNDAMIMIMDYKDYQVAYVSRVVSFIRIRYSFQSILSLFFVSQGEERPFLIAFKHGLEEEKV